MGETNELAVIDNVRLGSLTVANPHEVIVRAGEVAKELAAIIKKNHLTRNIQGREYVYVEGWSTMGAMLGVLPREVPELFRTFDDGSCEATVELIRINDGAIIGRASAFVGMDEKDRQGKPTWGSRPFYARKSMAVTRATGKAYRLGFSWIMGLAGYAPTPAEEMEGVIDGQARDVAQDAKDNIRQVQASAEKVMEQTRGNGNMTLDEAKAITNSENVKYGDIETDKLQFMSRSIGKKLQEGKYDSANQDLYVRKLEAIKLILAERGVLA